MQKRLKIRKIFGKKLVILFVDIINENLTYTEIIKTLNDGIYIYLFWND